MKLHLRYFSLVIITLLLYLKLGSWQQVISWHQLSSNKTAIKKMHNKLNNDPEAIIKILEKYPNEAKAQKILFKILVGMKSYAKANTVYINLRKQHQENTELNNMYAGVITNLNVSNNKKLLMLKQLVDKIDKRLFYFYKAEILASAGNFKQAKHYWQITLSQLSDNDEFYKLVALRIKNHHLS